MTNASEKQGKADKHSCLEVILVNNQVMTFHFDDMPRGWRWSPWTPTLNISQANGRIEIPTCNVAMVHVYTRPKENAPEVTPESHRDDPTVPDDCYHITVQQLHNQPDPGVLCYDNDGREWRSDPDGLMRLTPSPVNDSSHGIPWGQLSMYSPITDKYCPGCHGPRM